MITLKQIKLLEEAVDEAESWRGMHVGAAPDWFMDDFDDKIKSMRKAVEAVRRDRAELKAIRLNAAMYKSYITRRVNSET
jgi:hypothetical protein